MREDGHSASIALEALNLLDEDDSIYSGCVERGEQLREGLEQVAEKYPGIIKAVRGVGLMMGVEFHGQHASGSAAIRMLSQQEMMGYIIAGYLLNVHRIRVAPALSSISTLRLEPSAFISAQDCGRLIDAFERLAEVLYKQNVYALTGFIVREEGMDDDEEVVDFRGDYPEPEVNTRMKRVAFMGHFIEAAHIALWDCGFNLFNDDEKKIFLEKVYEMSGPFITEEHIIGSETGERVRLSFIGLCMEFGYYLPTHEKPGYIADPW